MVYFGTLAVFTLFHVLVIIILLQSVLGTIILFIQVARQIFN